MKVGGIANALDLNSRTMLAVLRVPNVNGPLMPGMFSRVKMMLPNPPSDAVVSRNEGQMVAVVGPDKRVHFRKVTISRDTGSNIEVTAGLSVGDQVVLNPTDEVREGAPVEIRVAEVKAPAGKVSPGAASAKKAE